MMQYIYYIILYIIYYYITPQGARVADDVSLMQRFMRTIGDDPDRAVYG